MERAGQVLVFKISSIPARCLELPEAEGLVYPDRELRIILSGPRVLHC